MIRTENDTKHNGSALRRAGAAGAHLRRRALSLAALAGSVLFAALSGGCVKDPMEPVRPGTTPDPTAGYATLQLVVPGVSGAGTYAATPVDEATIRADELHALVYIKNPAGDGYSFHDVVTPKISNGATVTNGGRRYDIQIPFGEGTYYQELRVGLVAGLTRAELEAAAGYDGAGQWPLLNASVADDDGNFVENPFARARSQIAFRTAGKWPVPPDNPDSEPFPMWGESIRFAMRPEGTVAGTIYLTRTVARVDVGVNFKKNDNGTYPIDAMQAQGLYDEGRSTYFELVSVSVFRTAKNGVVGSAADKCKQDDKTMAITAEAAMPDPAGDIRWSDTEPLKYTKDGRHFTEGTLQDHWTDAVKTAEAACRYSLTRMCYVPETPNKGAEFDAAACIVVGGRYGGADAAVSYYRIDFALPKMGDGGQLKPTPDTRLDLLRNHAYVVNITSVAGPGLPTEEEALHSDDTKLSAEIVEWDQSQQVGDIVTDGVYMLSVDKAEQQYYADGTAETFTVKTDYKGELGQGWTMEFDENTSDDFKRALLYYDKDGRAIGYDDPDWPSTGTPGATELRLGMARLLDNADGTPRTLGGTLVFKAGRLSTRVQLRQTSRENLRILFDPAELYFGPTGVKNKDEQSVALTVTTFKDYTLTLTGTAADGNEYTYDLKTASAANNPDAGQFKTFFEPVRNQDLVFKVLPQDIDPATDPDRVFTFSITATNTTAVDGAYPSVTERFTVYQLKEPKEWKVLPGTTR